MAGERDPAIPSHRPGQARRARAFGAARRGSTARGGRPAWRRTARCRAGWRPAAVRPRARAPASVSAAKRIDDAFDQVDHLVMRAADFFLQAKAVLLVVHAGKLPIALAERRRAMRGPRLFPGDRDRSVLAARMRREASKTWPSPEKGEGDGAPRGATSPFVTRLVDAWRLSARRPAFFAAPGRAFRRPSPAFGSPARPLLGGRTVEPRAGRNGPPSASSSRGVVVPPGGAPAPPERVLCEARPRAPARTPRAGATGSRPLMGIGRGGIKS